MSGREIGDRSSESWLLIHGFLDNAASFELFCLEFLAQRPGSHLVSLDLLDTAFLQLTASTI